MSGHPKANSQKSRQVILAPMVKSTPEFVRQSHFRISLTPSEDQDCPDFLVWSKELEMSVQRVSFGPHNGLNIDVLLSVDLKLYEAMQRFVDKTFLFTLMTLDSNGSGINAEHYKVRLREVLPGDRSYLSTEPASFRLGFNRYEMVTGFVYGDTP